MPFLIRPSRHADLSDLHELATSLSATGFLTLPSEVREIEDGVGCFRAEGCDLVLGIGGGSCLDAAKAVAKFAGCGQSVREVFDGAPFAAVVRRGHVMGAQFHPERSAAAGARLLHNFLSMEPA